MGGLSRSCSVPDNGIRVIRSHMTTAARWAAANLGKGSLAPGISRKGSLRYGTDARPPFQSQASTSDRSPFARATTGRTQIPRREASLAGRTVIATVTGDLAGILTVVFLFVFTQRSLLEHELPSLSHDAAS